MLLRAQAAAPARHTASKSVQWEHDFGLFLPSGFFPPIAQLVARHATLWLDMARPKKAASASRSNGARATNKGKARATVDVLVAKASRTQRGSAKVTVTTEKRAPLPKGYVAYESEVLARQACIEKASKASKSARKDGKKQSESARLHHELEKSEKMAIKTATEDQDADGALKLANLRELTGLRTLEWSEDK